MAEITTNTLAKICKALPSSQAILIRGAHGIGKSAIAQLLGRVFEIPVIDLRLSQMTEGDFIGLPKLYDPEYDKKGNLTKEGRTEFMPPSWFVQAMNEPVVLLLDEINRATPELMQCAFQLIYDRAVQGRKIHPGTRIVACVNASHHYQVNEMDPALLNRFWTCDLVPSLKDWLAWARGVGVDSSIIEFCSSNEKYWWHNPRKGLEPGKIYPTPRGWDMVNRALSSPNPETNKSLFETPSEVEFNHVLYGLVGDEAASKFIEFVKHYDRQITAEDVLDNYKRVQDRIKRGVTTETLLSTYERLLTSAEKSVWSKKQLKNLAQFIDDSNNHENAMSFWTKLNTLAAQPSSETTDIVRKNMLGFHATARAFILRIVGSSAGAS
jgi:hypothetical protein